MPLRSYNSITLDKACDLIINNGEISLGVYSETVKSAVELRHSYCLSIAAAVVPIYVTSICCEDCGYCNFRRSNHSQLLDRRRLTLLELEREIEWLIYERGYHALELVYANDPKISPDDVAIHIALCRRMLDKIGGGTVGVNIFPMSIDAYKGLVDAGLDFAVQWQETYDRERYSVYHPNGGQKIDYGYRYGAYERMLKAGIKHIGIGVLFGLAPWRKDFQSLLEHEVKLHDQFGRWPAILGTARLKPALGALVKQTEFLPTDKEFVFAVMAHTLFAPQTAPWISTRESWELCVKLAQGGCLFTFDCSTTPGGYSQKIQSCQFPTNDFPASTYMQEIEKHELEPIFNWQFRSHGGLRVAVSQKKQ